jgi:DNA-binding MurR/RpiR family transcriptional regulator
MNTQTASKSKLGGLINSYFPSLTKSEQKVAAVVLEQMEKALYYSVTDLADVAEVGETTVLRFCRKIGMKGYQEFKLAIAKDLSSLSQEEEADPSKPSGFIQSIASYTKNAIDETVNAKNRFLRIGYRSDAVIDPHIQSMTAATVGAGDVVIGLSISGSTKDTIDSLTLAKENGANVIAITYYARSPITKLADAVLLSGGKESPLEGGSMIAKISQLFVIDMLCTGLALHNKEYSLGMKEKTARAVVEKIY